MKFLIAGFGSIGRRHLNNLRTLGENDLLLTAPIIPLCRSQKLVRSP